MCLLKIFVLPLLWIAVMAFPRETGSPDLAQQLEATMTTTAVAPDVTVQGGLRCTDGSTILHTTDCTMGTPLVYCHKKQPPIECDEGFFPTVWHPDHCMEESTCFPLNAAWITTGCSNGLIPYSTKTLYDGVLAGGVSTTVRAVSCSCASDQWYSMSVRDGSSIVDTYCMPYDYCPPGMTILTSTDAYCATAAAEECQDVPLETSYCQCAEATETPIYPDWPGATAIGCM
ncbi:hypothetical protein N7478_007610 [Penicillium angulare]|uniref:uncharacterized protein n=1 Tax=Penicillium angulare TaxID=116970 RepID=UPI002541CCA1|nr:uncharacterized protein N7478_007610 [Penicillium angulare]KAJ5272485.1 hypothetical protein N7478_007610 [Penicillium angulare]